MLDLKGSANVQKSIEIALQIFPTLSYKFMAQFWIAVFFILLAIVQLFQSVKAIDLPLPMYLILGMVLAIAANPQSKFSFGASQSVTLQELKILDPVLTAQTTTLLAAVDTQIAATQLDAIEPKTSDTRPAAPKSSLLPTTKQPLDPSVVEPKKRTRKATTKSPQV